MTDKLQQLPFEVLAPEGELNHTFVITARIPVTPGEESNVLNYIRGMQMKNDITNTWIKKYAPGYGMEVRSGPRPVMATPGDRTSKITHYEQDFRLTRPI